MANNVNPSYVAPPMPGILDSTDHHRHEVAALDDDSSVTDARQVLERVAGALDRSAEYGRLLWTQLSAVGDYLREDLARGPAGDGLHTDEHWQRWQDVYATTLYALAGPRGDNGYATDQARLERRARTEDDLGTP